VFGGRRSGGCVETRRQDSRVGWKNKRNSREALRGVDEPLIRRCGIALCEREGRRRPLGRRPLHRSTDLADSGYIFAGGGAGFGNAEFHGVVGIGWMAAVAKFAWLRGVAFRGRELIVCPRFHVIKPVHGFGAAQLRREHMSVFVRRISAVEIVSWGGTQRTMPPAEVSEGARGYPLWLASRIVVHGLRRADPQIYSLHCLRKRRSLA